jgi:hypothetical protein
MIHALFGLILLCWNYGIHLHAWGLYINLQYIFFPLLVFLFHISLIVFWQSKIIWFITLNPKVGHSIFIHLGLSSWNILVLKSYRKSKNHEEDCWNLKVSLIINVCTLERNKTKLGGNGIVSLLINSIIIKQD